MKKKVLILTCIMILILSACGKGSAAVPQNVEDMRNIVRDDRYIIHACGGITDEEGEFFDYTNCREALINSYDCGYRIIEMDFHYTSDGFLVLGHAWGDLYQNGVQMTPGEPLTLEEYLKCKVKDRFTVLTFEDVTGFMRQHQDLYLVTDIKDDNLETLGRISDSCSDLKDRMIVQVYHAEEIEKVHDLGFDYVIYTLYNTDEEERTQKALREASRHNLVGITVPCEWIDEGELYNILSALDLPVYVHTVNDDDRIKHYFDMGIAGIYTDRTDL